MAGIKIVYKLMAVQTDILQIYTHTIVFTLLTVAHGKISCMD